MSRIFISLFTNLLIGKSGVVSLEYALMSMLISVAVVLGVTVYASAPDNFIMFEYKNRNKFIPFE